MKAIRNEIMIVSGDNIRLWSFNRRGRVVGRVNSSAANPIMKWLFDEKPIPVHENGVTVN